MNLRFLLKAIVTLCILATLPLPTLAQETQPGSACAAGEIHRFKHVGGPENPGTGYMLVCNGSTWKAVTVWDTATGNSLFQVDYDASACGSLKQGRLRYSSSGDLWEYCDGSAWVPFESAADGGLSGPSGCANIGDLCADGTVFAGWDPVRHDPLFIPTTDQGTTSQWKTSTGTDDITTDSIDDGRANTNQVVNGTTFPAFKLCKDSTTGGYSDWYLPSQVEMYYLWTVHDAIEAGGNITNFQNVTYWSSTEDTNNTALRQNFVSGGQASNTKDNAFRVRCVRR